MYWSQLATVGVTAVVGQVGEAPTKDTALPEQWVQNISENAGVAAEYLIFWSHVANVPTTVQAVVITLVSLVVVTKPVVQCVQNWLPPE